jgi:hypothetical protein
MSTPASSFAKRVGTVGNEPPSWPSPAAYLADRRAYSAATEVKPTIEVESIEKLLFPAGKFYLICPPISSDTL